MSNVKIVTGTYTDAQLHAMDILNRRVADAIDRNMQSAGPFSEFLNSGLAQYGLVTTLFSIPKFAKYGTVYGISVAIINEIINMNNTAKQNIQNGLRGGYTVIERIRSHISQRNLRVMTVKHTTIGFHGTDYFNGNFLDSVDPKEPRVDYIPIAGQLQNGQWEYYD